MDRMRRFPVLLVLMALPATAGKAPKRYIRWAPSWSDAVEEARACTLPIVVRRHGFY